MPPKGKVLIVDDDPIVLKITRARLESVGYEVETRGQALGTLETIAQTKPDAVLLDIKMPALTGDLLAGLLRNRKDLTVILHSGQDLATLEKKALETGAAGAITKTGDDRLFLDQFERLMSRRGAAAG